MNVEDDITTDQLTTTKRREPDVVAKQTRKRPRVGVSSSFTTSSCLTPIKPLDAVLLKKIQDLKHIIHELPENVILEFFTDIEGNIQ